MDYTPFHAVWEITYACNMRCKHCGSSCGEKYPDELTTAEALKLCDDLGALKLKILTLSGGEPFIRQDWHLLARRLTDRGVLANVISNGWFIDNEIIDKAIASGITNMAVSLDGLKDTHDFIRMKGAFDRAVQALDRMAAKKMPSVVCTSINKKNLTELQELKSILIEHRVPRWQFQIANPKGNLLENLELIIKPQDLETFIDFAYQTMKEGKIVLNLGDDIGYYTPECAEIKSLFRYNKTYTTQWLGCHAGKRVLGIRANGDISGCLSIRDDNYIEGNVREIPLKKLWTRPGAFAWNRNLTKDNLEGFCKTCQYGSACLAGCTGSKLTFCNTLGQNTYCLYRVRVEREAERIAKIGDFPLLAGEGKKCIEKKEYQLADIILRKALSIKPEDRYVLDSLGFVNFYLQNYKESKEFNEQSLRIYPRSAYAHRGLGICLTKLGEFQKGIQYMIKAIELADNEVLDYYYDLAVVLDEHKKTKQALKVLKNAKKLFKNPGKQIDNLYSYLQKKK